MIRLYAAGEIAVTHTISGVSVGVAMTADEKVRLRARELLLRRENGAQLQLDEPVEDDARVEIVPWATGPGSQSPPVFVLSPSWAKVPRIPCPFEYSSWPTRYGDWMKLNAQNAFGLDADALELQPDQYRAFVARWANA